MNRFPFRPMILNALLAAFTLLILIPATADGQALNRLRRGLEKAGEKVQAKVGEAVEKELDEEVDRKIDDTLSKWFGSGGTGASGSGASGSGAGSAGSGASGGMGGFGGFGMGMNMNAATESVYEFDYKISYQFESVDNGKTTRSRIISYLNSNGQYSAMHFQDITESGQRGVSGDGDAYMITDLKNNALVMLMDEGGEKSSIAFTIQQNPEDMLPEPDTSSEPGALDEASQTDLSTVFSSMYGYKEIGSRTISGYRTTGYSLSDANGEVEFWISQEPIRGYREMISASGNVPMLALLTPYSMGGGAIVEIVFNDREAGNRSVMRMEDGSGPTSHRVRMADYPRAM